MGLSTGMKADIESALKAGMEAGRAAHGGKNADYIPYLASVDPELFSLAIITADGQVYTEGDCDYAFAIESISKVFTLAMVMEHIGPDAVRDKIGDSPTGLPFNSIIALELNNDKPLSPLVNAGAIATVSLVPGESADECFEAILQCQCEFAGRDLAMSAEINASEQSTNAHNRAIAWLLESAGACYSDPVRTVDVYTRQCSTLINCKDLATMGATLVAGGINPLTKRQVMDARYVHYILAEMMMEGLYTASGDWAYEVGLPAKSGVGGGILAVMPGQLAIAAFSPRLDEAGNSIRGQAAVKAAAASLGLNLFKAPCQ